MNTKMRRRTDVGTGPLWVSNNKVLTGPKKPHARNPNFDAEETKILISLWGDPKVQKTLITTHKKQPVIAQIAEKMRDFGYHRSTEEINTRIKNLKCFYNRTKKELESGEINMTLWRHYEAMDEIMTRPIFGNIGTQLEYQSIYDAKRKMSSVEPTDHLQIISSESANDDEMTVKEELPSDEEVDNSEVVMQLLMQAKALARKKKAQEKAEAEAQAEAQAAENGELMVPKLEPLDEPLEEVTITKASSTTNPPTTMPALTITSVAPKVSDVGKSAMDTAAVTSSVPQSKISLVPTNVLMKPQPQQQPAPTVTYPQPKFIIQNTSPATSVAGSQAMPPMQLVFLQTPPTSNNGASIIGSVANSLPSLATVTTTTPSRPPLPMLKPKPAPPAQTVQYTIQQNGHTPQNFSQANGHARSMQANAATPNGANRRDSVERNLLRKLETDGTSPNGEKKGLGFRALLYQLVKLQNNNLIVNRQRLSVERQRLNVERTLGEQIVNSLQVLQKVFAPTLASDHATTNGAHKSPTGQPPAKRPRSEKEVPAEEPIEDEDDDADYDEDDDNMSGCD